MSLGVSWFLPSRDFQVLRCDAMQIWCCTASSLLNVSPCLAKMLSPSSPPPGPRLCWGPHPGQWTQCPAPGCGPGSPAGQGVSIMTPQPTPTSTRSLFIRVDFQKICAVGGEHCIQSNCLEVCKNYSAMSHVLIWRKRSQSSSCRSGGSEENLDFTKAIVQSHPSNQHSDSSSSNVTYHLTIKIYLTGHWVVTSHKTCRQ